MKSWIRAVIVFSAAASVAAPALATREHSAISRHCVRQLGFVCGDSWANYENCARYRADRLSDRCQGEVKLLMAVLEARRRGDMAAPAAGSDARPAPEAPPAP